MQTSRLARRIAYRCTSARSSIDRRRPRRSGAGGGSAGRAAARRSAHRSSPAMCVSGWITSGTVRAQRAAAPRALDARELVDEVVGVARGGVRTISRRRRTDATPRATRPATNARDPRAAVPAVPAPVARSPDERDRFVARARRAGQLSCPEAGKKQSIRWPSAARPSQQLGRHPGHAAVLAPGAGPSHAMRSGRSAIGAHPIGAPCRPPRARAPRGVASAYRSTCAGEPRRWNAATEKRSALRDRARAGRSSSRSSVCDRPRERVDVVERREHARSRRRSPSRAPRRRPPRSPAGPPPAPRPP